MYVFTFLQTYKTKKCPNWDEATGVDFYSTLKLFKNEATTTETFLIAEWFLSNNISNNLFNNKNDVEHVLHHVLQNFCF